MIGEKEHRGGTTAEIDGRTDHSIRTRVRVRVLIPVRRNRSGRKSKLTVTTTTAFGQLSVKVLVAYQDQWEPRTERYVAAAIVDGSCFVDGSCNTCPGLCC
jgi:hypothetical protein